MAMMQALHQKSFQEETIGTSSKDSKYGAVSTFELGLIPAPRPPLPGHVIVRVHAASLNPVDIMRPGLQLDEPFPIVTGYDVSGTVQEVASDVSELHVGDRVFGNVLPDTLGVKTIGSVAELVCCQADLLAIIPHAVSFVDAAALPLVCQTAIQTLRYIGAGAGCKLFMSAGAGGLGTHLLQIAKKSFHVGELATTASAGVKTDLVKKCGADTVVDYRAQDAGEVLENWADFVVLATTEYEMGRKIRKVQGGLAISVLSPDGPDIEKYLIQPTGPDMKLIARMVEEGSLFPVVDSVHEFKDSIKALERLASGRASGKVVIRLLDK